MNLEVIKLSEKYLDECVDVFMDTFSREPWNDEYDSKDQVKNYFLNYMKCNYFLGYIGLVDNKVAALSLGMKKPWLYGMEYYVDEFCVKYHMQGKNIGSIFINKIEELLKYENIDGIILNTEKDFPSCKFYRKNGFKQLGNLIVLAK